MSGKVTVGHNKKWCIIQDEWFLTEMKIFKDQCLHFKSFLSMLK